ncbi:MAG: hypothetical protein RJA24_1524, partial [Pseudomonadota bacterium]
MSLLYINAGLAKASLQQPEEFEMCTGSF